MVKLGIEIHGAEQLARKLKSLSTKAKIAINLAMFRAGAATERNIKVQTPVITGRLRGSIHTSPPKNMSVVVGTNVNYGPFVEYGTSRFSGRHMFKKGLAQSQPQIKRIVSDAIKTVI